MSLIIHRNKIGIKQKIFILKLTKGYTQFLGRDFVCFLFELSSLSFMTPRSLKNKEKWFVYLSVYVMIQLTIQKLFIVSYIFYLFEGFKK